MPLNLSRKEEQRGTRNIMMWGVVFAALIFLSLFMISIIEVTAK